MALSFVQKPEDVIEARKIIGDQAHICIKMEKTIRPHHLEELVALADGMMVARGDLGVELPPNMCLPSVKSLPPAAARNEARHCGHTDAGIRDFRLPVPTRAGASDVANAVYEGTDAVMLSTRISRWRYPIEAVTVMGKLWRR